MSESPTTKLKKISKDSSVPTPSLTPISTSPKVSSPDDIKISDRKMPLRGGRLPKDYFPSGNAELFVIDRETKPQVLKSFSIFLPPKEIQRYRDIANIINAIPTEYLLKVREQGYLSESDKTRYYQLLDYMGDLNTSSLAHFISKNTITRKDYLPMALKIAQGLAALHTQEAPLAHGDVATRNILIFGEKLCICDYDKTGPTNTIDADATRFDYEVFPPEHRNKKANYTTASDIYQLGNVLWSLAINRNPVDTLESGRIENLEQLKFPALEKLIKECWAEDPEQRPAITEIVTRLKELCKNISLDIKTKITSTISDTPKTDFFKPESSSIKPPVAPLPQPTTSAPKSALTNSPG